MEVFFDSWVGVASLLVLAALLIVVGIKLWALTTIPEPDEESAADKDRD